MGVWYATREEVKLALDYKNTARADAQIDRAIESASRDVEGCLKRRFYPFTGTRYKDWPNDQGSFPWRIWLDKDEVVSLTSLVSGGVTIPATDYFLEPANSGPPYNRLEIDLSSSSALQSDSGTHQRSIVLTGVFYWPEDPLPAGSLAAAISSTSATTVNVTDSAAIGVGHVIRVDSERMLVTGKSMLDTTINLGGSGLSAQVNDVTVPVSDGTAFHAFETILIDSERMLVVDIAGNNLTVKRAWDGSVLVAHATNADIYAARTLTVIRGALGTTAATHNNATAIVRHVVPGLVNALCIAKTLNQVLQESAGYARVSGSGDNQQEYTGRGIAAIEADAKRAYERRQRIRAV